MNPATIAAWLLQEEAASFGAGGPSMPAGLVHIYIPDADIGTTNTLVDTANSDNLANVSADPSANEIIDGFRMITLTGGARYVDAAAPTRITDEWSVLFFMTTDVATATARILYHTIGTFPFQIVLSRFAGIIQLAPSVIGTLQRSIMPDKDTVYDFAFTAANSGWRSFINGISTGSGSSGADDVTGALGNGIYYNRNEPGGANGNGKLGPLYIWNRALSDEEVENARLFLGRDAAA